MGLVRFDKPWAGENDPLLYLDRARKKPITFKRLYENVGVWAGTGVGKTSGADASIAMAAMAGGASLLLSGPKFNSAGTATEWARAVDHEKDVRLIRPGVRFNVNDWLLRRKPERGAVVKEVVDMVRELSSLSNRATMSKLTGDHPFFSAMADWLTSASVTVDLNANNSLSVSRVLKIMQTIPGSREAAQNGSSFCKEMCDKALQNAPDNALPEVRKAVDFLMVELPDKDGRLRGDCVVSAAVLWSALDREPLLSMFTGESDLTPEDLLRKGLIFVVDLPLAEGNEALIAFGIWKMAVQKALMDRCGKKDQRPCVVMLQEGQEYVTAPSDYRFVTECREASACFYYSSQSVATAVATIGREAFDALVACMNTQIFAQNPCMITNQYSSDAFGQYLKKKINVSGQVNQSLVPRFPLPKRFRVQDFGREMQVKNPQISASVEWEPCYRPEAFMHLQRGGYPDSLVEARVRMMSSDKTKVMSHECYFNQNLYKDPFKKPGWWCRGKDIVTLA